MGFDITKIANFILYMLEKDAQFINQKKVSTLLFLVDYENLQKNGEKIFADDYIKEKRAPTPKIMQEIFTIIENNEDLDEEDEMLFLIRELLEYIDIETISKKTHTELRFIKVEEEFDSSLFEKEELDTIRKIVKKYKDTSPRNIANDTFKIELVRTTPQGEAII
ncbi:type II toxin-antitoxin system antitoxin SocA domain-containing protein [Malaciobacter marinus]|uniref:type II toxin-antitoxin system antitoxin SocA domain-containing protein n=1 Tax=Malaciobacter marinus TaxID=505249 RepID=UPI003AFFAE62